MQVRVMHFMNQYFAGKGGEEEANLSVSSVAGPVGPGQRLRVLLGDAASIVVTAYCGDNYFSEHRDEALVAILQIARDCDVKIVVAGPAFEAGRYGFMCSEVCHFLSASAGLYCVGAMSIENPGVEGYRQYKDGKVFFFPSTESVVGMEGALAKMARCISKLTAGLTPGSASEEGYIPRGIRVEEAGSRSGAERAVDMLLDKLASRPFLSEIVYETLEPTPIAPKVANPKDAHLALVTTSGVVSEGNPDKLKSINNTQFGKYSIESLNSMRDGRWDVLHAGYVTGYMADNPNFGVPLDACRELEKEGAFARLYPYFYSSPGVGGKVAEMTAIGKRIARDLKAARVNAALVVPT